MTESSDTGTEKGGERTVRGDHLIRRAQVRLQNDSAGPKVGLEVQKAGLPTGSGAATGYVLVMPRWFTRVEKFWLSQTAVVDGGLGRTPCNVRMALREPLVGGTSLVVHCSRAACFWHRLQAWQVLLSERVAYY